jgi:DNA repair exonuclease SbcCD ATPase subunit
MSSRHITRVTSNVKKGVDMDLGLKTVIVGGNGQGKTSAVNAIELALCQQVTDLIGREVVKKPGDIIKLTSDKELFVECILSDGHEIKVTTKRTKTGATKPKVEGKIAAEMPYHNVRSHLTGSPEVIRTWLMSKGMGGDISRSDVVAEMDTNYHSLYKQSVSRRRKPEVDLLKMVIDANNSAVKGARDEVRMLERAVEHGSDALGKTVSRAELKRAEESEAEWRETLSVAERKTAQITRLQVEVETLQREVNVGIARLENLEKENDIAITGANLSPAVTDGDTRFLSLAQTVMQASQWNVDLKNSNCVVCGVKHSPTFFQTRLEAMDQQSRSIKEASAWHRKAANTTIALTELRDAIMTKAQLLNTKREEQAKSSLPSGLDELRSGWSDAKTKVDTLRLGMQQVERIQQDRKSLEAQKEKLDLLKGYASELKRVSAVLLETAKESFMERVQAFLPDGYDFQMELTEKSCEFGYQNGVGIKRALSGAEWASMLMALSAASVSGSEDLVVITPEERAFDPHTLSQVMVSLNETPHQVILTSTVSPSPVPDGWTVVNLDKQV